MELPWMATLRQQLLGALEPWMQVLATNARFSYDGSATDDPGDRELSVEISTNGAYDVRVFEALELLALLGGVDPRLFTIHVYSAAMRHSSWLRLPESTALPIQCVLRIRHGEDFPTAITTWCERLVLGGVEATASKEYTAMRLLLESAYKMIDTVPPLDGNPARVTREALAVRATIYVNQGDFEERTAQLAQVAMMQHARDTMESRVFRRDQWKPILRVAEVDVGMPRSISAKAFLYLAQIASYGIGMQRLRVNNMIVDDETASVFAQGLQLLLGTRRQVETIARGTLQEILLPSFMSERTVSALFSAIMVSQSLEVLDMKLFSADVDLPGTQTMTREQRAHLWKWIALAVFSRYASHRLKTVRLDVQNLDQDDMAAFRRALFHPEHALGSVEARNTPFDRMIASKFLLDMPLSAMMSGFGFDIEFDRQEVVVESHEGDPQNRDWLRVVLPGCGRAWVHRSCSTPAPVSSQPTNQPTRLPRLTISYMNDQSKIAVLELLQLIGSRVTDLHLVNLLTQEPLDYWLTSVVFVCPHLETLQVVNGGKITSMDVFVKMFEREACQVKSLELNTVRVDQTDSITQFLTTLGDGTNRASRMLQKISLVLASLPAPLQNIVPIVDRTLTANVTLQNLHLLATFQPHVPAVDFASISSLCEKHRNKPVAVRSAPLSLPQKCAFLSVMDGVEEKADSAKSDGANSTKHQLGRVMRRLDHRVLSLVFQFAADCKNRDVSMWFHTSSHPADDDGAQDEDGEEQDDEAFVGGGDNDRED